MACNLIRDGQAASPDPWTEERGGWLEGLALHPLSLVHAIGTEETVSHWNQLLSVTVAARARTLHFYIRRRAHGEGHDVLGHTS